MATKTSIIQIDVKSESVKFATDQTLTLKNQIVLLNKELQKLTDAGKIGSKEFQILSTALGDAEDKFAASKAQSKDLASTLSLLPGPVGEFGTQLSGSIGLLKTFSTFSLKDIAFQLKETANDFLDITKNILGLNAAEQEAVVSKEALATAQDAATTATEQATTATVEQTVVMESETVATEGATVATISFGQAMKAIGIGLIIAGIAALVTYWDDLKDAIMGTSNATRAYADAEKKAADNAAEQLVLLDRLSVAVKNENLTTREKNQLVNQYNKTLGDTLGKVTSYISLENKLTDPARVLAYKNMILQKAIAEASYQLVVDKTKEKLQALFQQSKESDVSAAGFFSKLGAGAAAAGSEGTLTFEAVAAEAGKRRKKAIITEFDDVIKFLQGKGDEATKVANATAEKLGLKVPKIEYTGETANKVEKVQYQDEEIIKRAKDLQELLTAEKVKGEKERARAEIIAAGEKEVRDIEAMKIDTKNQKAVDAKANLIANTRKQAQLKANESDKKFDEERLKEREDILKQMQELEVKAIQDEATRTKVERYNQYKKEEEVFKKALDDKLITQDQYNEAVKN
jgi:hypothetical protein